MVHHVRTLFLTGLLFASASPAWAGDGCDACPAELFPTSIRSTAHGLAAGFGKTGAAVGVFSFPILNAGLGLSWTLACCLLAALGGLVITAICRIKTTGLSLEELTDQSEHCIRSSHEFFTYPITGSCPVDIDGGARNTQSLRDLNSRQASKKTQPNNGCLSWIKFAKCVD